MRRDPIHNLDFLRTVAVLLVVCAHYLGLGPDWVQRGQFRLHVLGLTGVLLFFVHTSLVLMMSLERMVQETGGAPRWLPLIKAFYVRRFFRIYPLSVFAIVMATLLQIPADPFFPFSKLSARDLAANLLLMQNITKARNALSPLWSLSWEVQMYLVLPFLFMVARSRKLASLAAIGICTVVVNALGISLNIHAVRILDYAPCFLCGILAYMLLRRGTAPALPAVLWPPVLALLVAAALVIDWGLWKIYWGEWAIALAAGLLIPLFHDMPDHWLSQLCHVIAKYSYGIYLFHLPVLWLAFAKLRWLIQPVNTALFLSVTAGSSVLAYHFIEEPLIEIGKRWTRRREQARHAPLTVEWER